MELIGVLKIHEIIKEKSPRSVTADPINKAIIDNILTKATSTVFGNEKYGTPYLKAACILEGICRLHPFVDGNKRTAFYSAYAFLQQQGLNLDMRLAESAFIEYVSSVKEHTSEEEIDMLTEEIALWLEHRVKKR